MDGDDYLVQHDVDGLQQDDSQQMGDDQEYDGESFLREQDRYLPLANVARIMKNAIPGSGKVARDAKECAQECVSEFIAFVTSEASERCVNEKRKTINGDDVIAALQALGFDNYVEPLTIFLSKFREANKMNQPDSANETENAFGASVDNANDGDDDNETDTECHLLTTAGEAGLEGTGLGESDNKLDIS